MPVKEKNSDVQFFTQLAWTEKTNSGILAATRDGSDWWCYSVEALQEMMKDADFKNVEIKEHVGKRCVLIGYV